MTSMPPNVAALAQLEQDRLETRWPEPSPLYRDLPEGAMPPVEALGPILQPAVEAIARVIQCPPSTAAAAVLSGATLAVQPHADVEIDGRDCPTSEFFISVLESGQRKTAADRAALSPHHQHMKAEADTYRDRLHRHQALMASREKTRSDLLRSKKCLESRTEALEGLGPEPHPPMSPYWLIEEPTYEGLVKLLIQRPHAGVMTSEASRFIGGSAMSKENRLMTLGGLTAIWDGQPITRSRAGDGTSILYGRRVSVHLMAQPLVATDLLGDRLAADQGFLARCCISAPASVLGSRTYVEGSVFEEPGWAIYVSRIRELLARPLLCADHDPFELRPRRIRPSAEAKGYYLDFQQWKENNLRPGGELRLVPSWAERSPEHALRFAGVFAVIADPETTEIDAQAMVSGIRWAHFYLGEALRLRDLAATSTDLQEAQRLLTWIRSTGKRLVPLPDVYQRGPATVRDQKTARKLMAVLEEHGHVRTVPGGAEIDGQRRRDVYEVRPEGV